MSIFKIFCSILVICPLVVKAQLETDISDSSSEFDTLYIKSYADKLAIKLYGVTKSNKISHVDDFTGQMLNYKPNDKFNIGVGFNYKWLGLDLAFNFPFINDDDDQFGETDRLDIQSNLYLRKFAFDFNFQLYNGYYVSNPNLYFPSWTSDQPNPQRPDINTTTIGLNAFYIFKNHKFSYRSTFIFNERQTKSAGSWLAGPFFTYFTFDADSSIIPAELINTFNPDIDFRETRFTQFGVAGGYAHTFVIGHKFFFSLTLAVGLGPEFRTSTDPETNEKTREIVAASKVTGRTAIGFNSDRTFFGITTVAGNSGGGEEDDAWLEHNVNNLRVFFGKRFDVSRWKKPKE